MSELQQKPEIAADIILFSDDDWFYPTIIKDLGGVLDASFRCFAKADLSCSSDQLADMTHLLMGLQHIFNNGDEA